MSKKLRKEKIEEVTQDYYTTFGIASLPVTHIVTNDMKKTYTDIRPDFAAENPDKMATAQMYNGLMVPPAELDGTFTVLLNYSYVQESLRKKNMNWVGTIAHETTHINDYIEYARLINEPSYDQLQSIDEHGMFQLWTEWNARAKGYYFVRKYTFNDLHDDQQVKDIMKIELPAQSKLLAQNYSSTQSGFQQAYYVAHYLGRLHTLQQLFPGSFTNKYIQDHLRPNDWMYDWFEFFCKYNKLPEVYEHFEEMKDILRQNFKGL